MGSASPYDMDSPESSPPPRHQSASPTATTIDANTTSSPTNGSIFPKTMPIRDELLTRLRERAAANAEAANRKSKRALITAARKAAKKSAKYLPISNGETTTPNSQWLQNWLANNPIASSPTMALASMQQQMLMNGSMLNGSSSSSSIALHNNNNNSSCPLDDDIDDDDDALEINTMDETNERLLDDDDDDDCVDNAFIKVEPNAESLSSVHRPVQLSISGNPLNSLLYKKKLNNVLRNKRKTSKPRCLSSKTIGSSIERLTAATTLNGRIIGSINSSPKDEPKHEQPSPTVSDSHTSGSSSGAHQLNGNNSCVGGVLDVSNSSSTIGQQQQKCFECQVNRCLSITLNSLLI